MKSLPPGKSILVSVENITPTGIWLFVNGKEDFLSYNGYPFFKEQKLSSIHNVQLLHGDHLYWSDLDVDSEIDNLEHTEKYPLKAKTIRELVREKPAKKYKASTKN